MVRIVDGERYDLYRGETDVATCYVLTGSADGGVREICPWPEGETLRGLAVDGADPVVVDIAAERSASISVGPTDWAINGCDDPVNAVLAASIDPVAMTTSIACAGEFAVATVGSVFLNFGPPDGLIETYERVDGSWMLTDYGIGIDCDITEELCAAFSIDVIDEAVAPIPPAPSG